MKIWNKSIIAVSALLFSGTVLAFNCPPAGGPYELSGHNDDGTHCTYTSVKTFKLDLRGGKLIKPQCPAPIITDPGYRLVGCNHNALKSKCICTTVHN